MFSLGDIVAEIIPSTGKFYRLKTFKLFPCLTLSYRAEKKDVVVTDLKVLS